MKYGKSAGLVLAVGVCAGIATWGVRSHRIEIQPEGAGTLPAQAAQSASLRIALPVVDGASQPIVLDAAMARAAVRDGALQVALPDGTRYPVRIERQYTDHTGHWNVVGRADTRFGKQPMVLTFGAGAVFGTLPTPGGALLRITTGPDHKVAIAPAGGMVPSDVHDPAAMSDVVLPPSPLDQAPSSVAGTTQARTLRTSGAQIERMASTPAKGLALTAGTDMPVETTPVDIEVLAVYTPEQLALRGSYEATTTEIANLFAIANQAHIDSGSRVRLVEIGPYDYASTPGADNQTALFDLVNGDAAQPIRDARGDLTVLVRPRVPNQGCGMAFQPSYGHLGTLAQSHLAYSVINVDGDCTPYVLAHETGHLLGAMHDHSTERTGVGQTYQGAYMFSYGHSTDAFADIMARPEGSAWRQGARAWLPYFANPDSTLCGAPCGVAGYSDVVRTFNRMAPAVAAFHGHNGTIAIPDGDAVEPFNFDRTAWLEIRYTGPVQAGGIALTVDAVGGTATEGVDFVLDSHQAQIAWDSGIARFPIRLLPDAENEGNETIVLHITAPNQDAAILDDTATFTIVEPERHVVSGRLVFPSDRPQPDAPITMALIGAEDDQVTRQVQLLPPDFAYQFVVPAGAEVAMTPQLPPPFVLWPGRLVVPDVRADVDSNWRVVAGLKVSGTVRAQTGMTLPPQQVQMQFIEWAGDTPVTTYVYAKAPDYTFAQYLLPGHDLMVSINAGSPFLPYRMDYYNLTADTDRIYLLGTQPILRAVPDQRSMLASGGMVAYLDSPAGPGGVTFRCRAIDRTAKAGRDYVATSAIVTIPEGQQEFAYCGDVRRLADTKNGLTKILDVVIDQVTGATLTTESAPIMFYPWRKLRTGGPTPASEAAP